MRCPACKGNLSIVSLHGTDVGICPLCEGIWFDSAGLKIVVDEMIAAGEVETPETTVFLKPRKVQRTSQQGEIRMCPDCGLVMKNLNYATDSNVFINKCDECGGIWTDKGRLMAIAEYIKGDPRSAQIAEGIIESDKKTRRTAKIMEWIGELLDIL